MLNDTVSGVARPLKSRISQVINSLARRPDNEHVEESLGNMDGLGGVHGASGRSEEASTARIRLSSLLSGSIRSVVIN